MRYVEFVKNENAKNASVLFFYGEESFFRENAIKVLKERTLAMEGIDFDVFDAKSVPIETVASILNTPPFLNKKRLVVLKEYYPTAKEYEKGPISFFAKTEQDFAVLAIINEKTCDAIVSDSYFLSVDCAKESDTYLSYYAQKKLEKVGVALPSVAASVLAESCAGSMTRLSVEIEKLVAFSLGKEKITKDDVENLVHRDIEMQVFDLTEALSKRNSERSLRILDLLIANNEKPQMIFAAIYNAFRRMLHVSLSSKTDAELTADLGVKSAYAIKKSRQAASGFSKKSLKMICDKLCDSDQKMKSGGLVSDGVLYDCVYYILST